MCTISYKILRFCSDFRRAGRAGGAIYVGASVTGLAITRGTFIGNQADGAVAVNVVWLVTRTTVKGSIDPNDSGLLAPLAAPEGEDVVAPLSGPPRRAPHPTRS